MAERRELVGKYTRELSDDNLLFYPTWEQSQEIMLRVEAELKQEEVEAELKQENSESVIIPSEYDSALSLLYSKSFITSLDTIGRLIDSLYKLVNDF
jgi:hypothetical protein